MKTAVDCLKTLAQYSLANVRRQNYSNIEPSLFDGSVRTYLSYKPSSSSLMYRKT